MKKNNKENKLIVSFEPEPFEEFVDFVQVILEEDSTKNENEDKKMGENE